MGLNLFDQLTEASERNKLPSVTAFNRIDGPGSSLDLREFQQALWTLPNMPRDPYEDPSMLWSNGLPRTVGITIDTGTVAEAHPYKPNAIAIQSIEYGVETSGILGEVPPTKENWLLKILDIFGLSGIKVVLRNLRAGTHSAGLGGSATATTAVCILANELARSPLSPTQIVSMASRIEQDLGVSITGTQEQSNVLYGGVVDYIWFPWGIPGRPETGYGESLRAQLVKAEDFDHLKQRMAIFHTGKMRASTDVNSVWRSALTTNTGFLQHREKLELAYLFREGIRRQDWEKVCYAVRQYRDMRTVICPDYMAGSEEIHGWAEATNSAAFPLGAGGGGGVVIFSETPERLCDLERELGNVYRQIPFNILPKGNKLTNLPLP